MPSLPAKATQLALAGLSALLLIGFAVGPSAAADDDVEAALEGFEDPEAALDDTEAALEGFDDDTEAALDGFGDDDVDAALDGFGDDDVDAALDGFGEDDTEAALEGFGELGASSSASTSAPADRFYDVSGSLSLGGSFNVLRHRSSIGPGDTPEEILAGTDYFGLQRLRTRGDLQIDADLPYDWQLRAQGFLWFDFAYLIHGRESYTTEILKNYEFVSEVLDLWVAGTLFERLDLKLGRQVVNWGRSDTVRVTDVLNSLDNREPGLADIENLRLPATMAKADYFAGPFRFTALVIPEIRYDYDPPAGSDFFVLPTAQDFPPPRPPLISPIDPDDVEDRRASRWGSAPEYGGAVEGIFSGWDVSFYVARIYQNRSTLTPGVPGAAALSVLENDRVTMVGGGGNYTLGSWLLKAELAWFKDVDYVFLQPVPTPQFYDVDRILSGRVDAMVGFEYYGFNDTTIALEVVNRHIIDYDPLFQFFPNYVDENQVEYALRISQDWMNARLHSTILAYVIGYRGQGGAILRGEVTYDVIDGLAATLGFVGYVPGEDFPIRSWGKNQRAFFKFKYSF